MQNEFEKLRLAIRLKFTLILIFLGIFCLICCHGDVRLSGFTIVIFVCLIDVLIIANDSYYNYIVTRNYNGMRCLEM